MEECDWKFSKKLGKVYFRKMVPKEETSSLSVTKKTAQQRVADRCGGGGKDVKESWFERLSRGRHQMGAGAGVTTNKVNIRDERKEIMTSE